MTDEEGRPHKFKQIDGLAVAGIYDEEFKDWTGKIEIPGYDVELILDQEECRALGAQLMSIGRRVGPRLAPVNRQHHPKPEDMVIDEATLDNILNGRPFEIGLGLKPPYIEALYHDHGWTVHRITRTLRVGGGLVAKVMHASGRPYPREKKKR